MCVCVCVCVMFGLMLLLAKTFVAGLRESIHDFVIGFHTGLSFGYVFRRFVHCPCCGFDKGVVWTRCATASRIVGRRLRSGNTSVSAVNVERFLSVSPFGCPLEFRRSLCFPVSNRFARYLDRLHWLDHPRHYPSRSCYRNKNSMTLKNKPNSGRVGEKHNEKNRKKISVKHEMTWQIQWQSQPLCEVSTNNKRKTKPRRKWWKLAQRSGIGENSLCSMKCTHKKQCS